MLLLSLFRFFLFFFNDTATTEIYTLSLHDALPIFGREGDHAPARQHEGGLTERRSVGHPRVHANDTRAGRRHVRGVGLFVCSATRRAPSSTSSARPRR